MSLRKISSNAWLCNCAKDLLLSSQPPSFLVLSHCNFSKAHTIFFFIRHFHTTCNKKARSYIVLLSHTKGEKGWNEDETMDDDSKMEFYYKREKKFSRKNLFTENLKWKSGRKNCGAEGEMKLCRCSVHIKCWMYRTCGNCGIFKAFEL